MNEKSKRQSNIELLRIIAMVMIVAHHLSYYGSPEFDITKITVNRLWSQFLIYGGQVGVDLFVLISGYFLVNTKSLKLDKIVKLWLQMLFYSLGLYIVAVLFLKEQFSTKNLLLSITPFLNREWSFASAFLVLMILSPFINVGIKHLNKSSYRLLLGILAIIWIIIPTFSIYDAQGNYLTWLITLYLIAGYIRLYPEDFNRSAKRYGIMSVVMAILSFASAMVLDVLGLKIGALAQYATHFSSKQYLNIVLWAIFMFLWFVKINAEKIKASKAINFIASLMFGVYLIHENYYIRNYLWNKLFDNSDLADSNIYILITVGEICAIMIVCGLIEFIRANFIERLYINGLKKIFGKMQKKIDGYMNEL